VRSRGEGSIGTPPVVYWMVLAVLPLANRSKWRRRRFKPGSWLARRLAKIRQDVAA